MTTSAASYDQKKPTRLDVLLVPLFLLAVSLICFRLSFSLRGPIDEEMVFLQMAAPTGGLTLGLFDTAVPYRLLHEFLWGVAYKLFGWHFHPYLWLMPLMHWLNALVYWQILKNLLPQHYWIALSAALLWLVYPADPTRTIVGMLGHSQSLLLFLIGIWCLIRLAASSRQSILLWIGMFVGSLASLLSYEQLTPLTLFIPCILYFYPTRGISKQKVMIAAVWWLSLFLLIGLRIFLVAFTSSEVYAFGGGKPSWLPLDLLNSYIGWNRLGLIDAWYWAVQRLRIALALRSPELRTLPLTAAIALPIGLLLAGLGLMTYDRRNADDFASNGRPAVRIYLSLMAAGLIIAALAYVLMPIVYVPPPDTDLFQNRNHTAPGLGFALFYSGLLALIATGIYQQLTTHIRQRVKVTQPQIMWFLVAVLAGLGSLWHISRAQSWQRDWEVKAELWRAILDAVPGVQSDTLMILVTDDDQIPVHLRGAKYITPMLQILYNNPRVFGDNVGASQWLNRTVYFNSEGAILDLAPAGYRYNPRDFSYDQIVILYVSREGNTFQAVLIDCIPTELVPELSPPSICGNRDRITVDSPRTIYAQKLLSEDR